MFILLFKIKLKNSIWFVIIIGISYLQYRFIKFILIVV